MATYSGMRRWQRGYVSSSAWSVHQTLGRFSLEPDRQVVGDQIVVNEQDVLDPVDKVDVDKPQESGRLLALFRGIQGQELGAAGKST